MTFKVGQKVAKYKDTGISNNYFHFYVNFIFENGKDKPQGNLVLSIFMHIVI